MKGPTCIEDARKGVLCSKCEQKLSDGKISALDFEILKAIVSLDQTIIFADLNFSKAIEMENQLLLLCSGNIGSLIGKEGKNIKELSEKLKHLGKRIRIIEQYGDERKQVQELLGKGTGIIRLIALTKTYSPNMEKYCKVMVSKNDEKRLPATKEHIETALNALIGAKTEIIFT